jgi:hypothetical protein
MSRESREQAHACGSIRQPPGVVAGLLRALRTPSLGSGQALAMTPQPKYASLPKDPRLATSYGVYASTFRVMLPSVSWPVMTKTSPPAATPAA